MKRFHRILLVAALFTAFLTARAIEPEFLLENLDRVGSNHYAYPIGIDVPVPTLSPTPAGYEPFYIDHYGRHGSRWLTSEKTYNTPVRQLEKAHADGMLTEQGYQLLRTLRLVALKAYKRTGDLSDIGAEQHRQIAQRMAENFPEILKNGEAAIDARSTTVIRCILSMQNATTTLRSINPDLHITTDASVHDMHYMGWGYGEDTLAVYLRKTMEPMIDSLYHVWVNPARFIKTIVKDSLYAAENIDGLQLMRDVFGLAGNMQSHHELEHISLYHLFTTDELFTLWRIRNIYWYVTWGGAPQNGRRMPFIERALLRNIIATADSAIANGIRGANLRFGHETCVLPLATLLEIDSVDYQCHDLEQLHNHWQDFNIIPKGCNVQMIFYRPLGITTPNPEDVLVKVLFNEHEATLPFTAVQGAYYHWNDLREYYLRKLAVPTDWPQPSHQ